MCRNPLVLLIVCVSLVANFVSLFGCTSNGKKYWDWRSGCDDEMMSWIGQRTSDIDEKYDFNFIFEDDGSISMGEYWSADGKIRAVAAGCNFICGLMTWNQLGEYDTVQCVDAGTSELDARQFEREFCEEELNLSEWICENCEYGPQNCCSITVEFHDYPREICQSSCSGSGDPYDLLRGAINYKLSNQIISEMSSVRSEDNPCCERY